MRKNSGRMRDLAFHFESMRSSCRGERLMVVFDIDGTILDHRHMTLSVLQAYDRVHGTRYFMDLIPEDLPCAPREVISVLKEYAMPQSTREAIAAWCDDGFWSSTSMLGSHRPFHGVFDVIRWFQLQENTSVGLNTSRPESLRTDTLRILNALGRDYRVRFDGSLLHMSSGMGVPEGKADGIRYFQGQGFRVVAVIDNERENLDAVARIDPAGEILLLHADPVQAPLALKKIQRASSSRFYDLTELIGHRSLPRHVELVWHGVDEETILRQFLVSPIRWAELHVCRHVNGRDLVLRRKPYRDAPPVPGEKPARLDDFLYILHEAGRGVKLDLKDPGLAEGAIDLLISTGFRDERVWMTVTMDEVCRGTLRTIADAFPGAIRQCPVDSLSGMLASSPAEARRYLGMLSHAGIDRFSVNWNTPGSRSIVVQLQNWGYDVNVYNVPDLEAFLQAALLLPTSLTSFFNFPKWFYTGHGEAHLWRKVEAPPYRLI